jgi:riboflavin synthase alpha subunit
MFTGIIEETGSIENKAGRKIHQADHMREHIRTLLEDWRERGR